jgi:hypothetical protein
VTFLKAAGVGVSDGSEAAYAGLAKLAVAAEEVMAQCDVGEVKGLETFWDVEVRSLPVGGAVVVGEAIDVAAAGVERAG